MNDGTHIRYIDEFKILSFLPQKTKDYPDIRPIGKRLYQLQEDWSIDFLGMIRGEVHSISAIINKGFLSDGQSTPPISWTFTRMLPDGIVRSAALFHDALYRSAGNTKVIKTGFSLVENKKLGYLQNYRFGRKACDQIYRDLYIASAMGMISEIKKARTGYAVLRMFGRKHFGRAIPYNK